MRWPKLVEHSLPMGRNWKFAFLASQATLCHSPSLIYLCYISCTCTLYHVCVLYVITLVSIICAIYPVPVLYIMYMYIIS